MNQTQKHTTGKKLLALLLALIMSVSLLPMSVFAADLEQTDADGQPVVEQGVEDAVTDETDGQDEEAVPQEPVEDVQEPAEDETDVTDADIQAAEGDVAVQAAEINYVTKTGNGKTLDDSTFYRIVHIDCGRKYFSVADLKKIINYAAASNYTHVELAFGNDGLRFLLDDMEVTASGVTYGSDDVKSAIQAGNKAFYDAGTNELIQSEMKEIISYANSKGIGIIPMFDAPGHLQTVVRAMAILGVATNEYTTPTTSGTSVNYAINLTDAASVNFVQALMQKYITYFKNQGCTMFNIAADECGFSNMNNTTYTAYANLVNSMAAMVQNTGMVALAFNDGIYHIGLTTSVEFDSNIAVCYWDASSTKYAPAATLAGKGFKIINTNNKWYYVIGKENITNRSDWSGYAYTCQYAKEQMSSENSCLSIDGDSNKTTPVGCMAAIWCDYPSNSANWTNVESYIQTLSQYNSTYFVKAAVPAIKVDSANLTVDGTTTLTMANVDASATVTWKVTPEGVIELSATTGASITAKALKAGTATVTATVNGTDYTTKITVQDAGDETFNSEKDIYVTVGGETTESVTGANYAGDYTTKDESIASVTVTGENEKEGTEKYTSTRVSYRNLASSISRNWTETSYYYQVGNNYYPVYVRYQNNYYYYGYSTTGDSSNVTSIDSSRWGSTQVPVYTKTGVPGTSASTTITFTGKKVGDTYVIIGGVKYNIHVVAEDLSKAGTLPIQTWFTNCDIEVVATENNTQYTVGQTTGNFVNGNWQDNKQPYYVSVSAKDAYGADGVPLSAVLPATMLRYENSNTYWQQAYTGKVQKELVLWTGRIHSSSNIQLISGKDYSNTGTEFQYVRYFGGAWAVSADRINWTTVTGAGSTTNSSSCTEQLAVYYMMRSEITKEVTTDVADWGYIKSDSTYGTQISSGNYVILDFAVKYEGGTRNPNTFPQDGKTFVFHCTPNDASGSVKQDSSGNYYRQLNNFRGVNTSEYEIYMVTVTMTEDAAGDTLSSTTSYTYDGEEQIVWAIDQETHDNCGLNDYQAITSGDTYSGCKIGGDPYVRGVEVYNQHGALITYYIRLKAAPEDSLRVHYINKTTGEEFYNYSISVEQGTVFDKGFDQVAQNSTELTGNTVKNYLGFTETVIAELEKISGIGAQYKYSNYTCVDTSRNDDGKDVFLYYTFVTTKTFVVDFGLPVVIRPADIAERLSQANIERMSIVAKTKYADIERNNADFSFSYKLTATIDGQDDINVTYYGTNSENKPDNATYTVSMIPASTVYYEDSFAKLNNGVGAAAGATWSTDGATTNETQVLEELGKKQNLYGYDEAYDNCTTFSMGSAKKVTVSADMAANWDTDANSAWPTATFTFKGTGFDVISLTDNRSGAIVVKVYEGKDTSGKLVKSYIVNNYYGYQYNDATKTWEVSNESGANALYQIPVMKIADLTYGEYTAVIKVSYGAAFDFTNSNSYSFWLDAIRVYDPMGENADYAQDGEGWPQYIKLRTELKKNVDDEKTMLFIDGADQASVADYANYGPNNEVYLAKGQAISFKLTGDLESIATVQIGAKSPDGTEAKAKISVNNQEIASATEMYYDITTDAKNGEVVTIVNNGADDTILSLTNLKVTFTGADKSVSLAVLNAEDTNNAVAAVRALLAAPVEPDPEPEVFVPEYFQATWNRGTVKVGQKATLTVKTSADVEAITVDGKTIDTYRTRTERTGWGWNATKVTYHVFTFTVTAAEAGTLNYSIVAANADGVNSEAFDVPALTVQAASQRPGIGGWLDQIFGRWF